MRRRIGVAASVTLALLTLAAGVFAQTGGGLDLSWFTVDGGGGTSTGGSFSLDGTVGQADADPHAHADAYQHAHRDRYADSDGDARRLYAPTERERDDGKQWGRPPGGDRHGQHEPRRVAAQPGAGDPVHGAG